MNNHNNFTIKFTRLIQKVREIRGKILDEVIFIEFILDLIILKYFCESTSKIELFQATLLNQQYMPFDSKVKTFKNLKFGDRYEKTVKELGSNLDRIRKKRNELVHRMIDNSNEAINKGERRLVFYEGGKKKTQLIKEDNLQKDLNLTENIKTGLLVLFLHGDFSRSSEIDIKIG